MKIIAVVVVVLFAIFYVIGTFILPYLAGFSLDVYIGQIDKLELAMREVNRANHVVFGEVMSFPQDYFLIQIFGDSERCMPHLEELFIKGKFLTTEPPFSCNESFCLCMVKFKEICEPRVRWLPILGVIWFPPFCYVNWSSAIPSWIETEFTPRFYSYIAYGNFGDRGEVQSFLAILCEDFFNGTQKIIDGSLKSYSAADYIIRMKCVKLPVHTEEDMELQNYFALDDEECFLTNCSRNAILWVHTNESTSFKIFAQRLEKFADIDQNMAFILTRVIVPA
ncbi:MAG: hypothetical protein QW507_02450 [Candidatus Nanoarchaeia archaeon]|nr:hypothetical protein [Candidatus Haiyanarchaeum thermophilum]MCW1303281.1 hypothetical protein [Candidatus Haiyanarchaeum thermophilum]MCW1303987.1 hypothetical protein [Candidatus Haiyanarchaeum thermophilum]MCW1306440.1 hypothetical protein [Candidatus Haiyanarchaeum thermophilum]MCW1307262.1 hypothetical protein [Candidatus Haiyanarchaeum thermophilum]